MCTLPCGSSHVFCRLVLFSHCVYPLRMLQDLLELQGFLGRECPELPAIQLILGNNYLTKTTSWVRWGESWRNFGTEF
ncbi:hypothetical protein CMEL01_11210 [Colletotrichum melonis]|uniref:Uncharacterized protein n=1 Tax=Colletotrichum melonis TaxID=1209925 RepID=A0AAI9V1Y5_9PEZI|nr:hypothetical protein CMEL01_11210 [Colletotrichum melonis]